MPARWSDDDLLRAGASAGGKLTIHAYRRHRSVGDPSVSTISRYLGDGSWPAAVARAGLTTSGLRPYRHRTTAEVLDAVAAWWATTDDHSLAAYRVAVRTDPTLPPEPAVQRLAGGWKGVRTHINSSTSRTPD